MKEKEFVNGDAYIVSRNWKPVTCNWCNSTTTTSIRVPSLMMYLSWCEQCQKVPYSSWKTHKKMFTSSDDIQSISVFDSLLNEYYLTGCDLKTAHNLAVNEYNKSKSNISFEHLSSTSFQHAKNIDVSDDLIDNSNLKENLNSAITHDYDNLISNIIDLNAILKKVLVILTDQEREILVLILHKHQIDNFLTDNIKMLLYNNVDINTLDNTKLNQIGIAKFLGYHDRIAFWKYQKTIKTLITKTKNILFKSGFSEELKYMENESHEKHGICLS